MFEKRARCLYYKLNGEKRPVSKTEMERTARLKAFFKDTDIYSINMDQFKQKITEIIKIKNNERIQDDEKTKVTTINTEKSEAAGRQVDDSYIEPEDQLINDDVTLEDDETISLDEFSDTDEEIDEGENLIIFQIEDIKLMSNVISTLRPNQWLTDDIIMAFMKCFPNKKTILDYHTANLLTQDNVIERNLFPNVIIVFDYMITIFFSIK